VEEGVKGVFLLTLIRDERCGESGKIRVGRKKEQP
jgi:hypothetical protein